MGIRSPGVHLTAAIGYAVAVVLFVLLQEVGLRLRREEHRAWWAGTGRDLLNGVGFAVLTISLYASGFPGPVALVTGATVTLALFGTSVLVETWAGVAHPRCWSLVAGLVLAIPVIVFPEQVMDGVAQAFSLLFLF